MSRRGPTYADMVRSRYMYDRSIYPTTYPKYDADLVFNKARVWLMNHDVARSAIKELIMPQSKIYSFQLTDTKADG